MMAATAAVSLFGCVDSSSTPSGNSSNEPPTSMRMPSNDNDWNVSLYANCTLPRTEDGVSAGSGIAIDGDRKLLMTLQAGQIGGCSTDNMARHNAPYWERAELRQRGHMSLGRAYSISFEATFQEGFTGRQETFFQIHGWNGNCTAYPPLMLFFSGGYLNVWALRNVGQNAGSEWLSSQSGRHYAVQTRNVSIHDLMGQPARFEIRFDTREEGRLSVYLNGRSVVENASLEYASCAKPHIKLGVYRPGGSSSHTSAVIFDDITIQQID